MLIEIMRVKPAIVGIKISHLTLINPIKVFNNNKMMIGLFLKRPVHNGALLHLIIAIKKMKVEIEQVSVVVVEVIETMVEDLEEEEAAEVEEEDLIMIEEVEIEEKTIMIETDKAIAMIHIKVILEIEIEEGIETIEEVIIIEDINEMIEITEEVMIDLGKNDGIVEGMKILAILQAKILVGVQSKIIKIVIGIVKATIKIITGIVKAIIKIIHLAAMVMEVVGKPKIKKTIKIMNNKDGLVEVSAIPQRQQRIFQITQTHRNCMRKRMQISQHSQAVPGIFLKFLILRLVNLPITIIIIIKRQA